MAEIAVGPGLRGIPRLDPSDGFAEYEGKFDPTNMNYLASCFFMGIVGYALSIVTIVIFILIILFSILRKLFCCCPAKPPKPPSAGAVRITNLIALIFTAICGIGCFLVFAGSPQVVDGAAGVTGALLDGIDPLQGDLEFIADQMNISTDNGVDMSGSADSMTNLNSSLDDVVAKVDEVDAAIEGNIKLINQIFLGFSVIYLLFCVLGAFAGWKKMGFLLKILFFLAFFLLVVAWMLFGLSMTISQLSFDLCDAIEIYIEDPANSDLSALMPCMDREAAETLENDMKTAIFDALSSAGDLCIGKELCKGTPDSTVNVMDDDWDEQVIQQMVDQGMPRQNAKEQVEDNIVAPVTAAQALFKAIEPTVDLAECTFVQNTFEFVLDDACDPLRAGLDLLYPGLLLISIGFNAMWIIYLVWSKRAGAKKTSEVEMA